MAEWTREINTDFNFENIDILNVKCDGVLKRYEAVPKDGYVMYDTTENITEPKLDPETGEPETDPETGEIIKEPVTHYYTLAGFPLTYDFSNFSQRAVPCTDKEEKADE